MMSAFPYGELGKFYRDSIEWYNKQPPEIANSAELTEDKCALFDRKFCNMCMPKLNVLMYTFLFTFFPQQIECVCSDVNQILSNLQLEFNVENNSEAAILSQEDQDRY